MSLVCSILRGQVTEQNLEKYIYKFGGMFVIEKTLKVEISTSIDTKKSLSKGIGVLK